MTTTEFVTWLLFPFEVRKAPLEFRTLLSKFNSTSEVPTLLSRFQLYSRRSNSTFAAKSAIPAPKPRFPSPQNSGTSTQPTPQTRMQDSPPQTCVTRYVDHLASFSPLEGISTTHRPMAILVGVSMQPRRTQPHVVVTEVGVIQGGVVKAARSARITCILPLLLMFGLRFAPHPASSCC